MREENLNRNEGNPHRNGRITEVVLRTVSSIIKEEIEVKDTLVTVKEVVLSPNHQHARILISIFPQKDQEEISLQLKAKIGRIQKELNSKLRIRPVPKISFEYDQSEERARHIMDILDEVEK